MIDGVTAIAVAEARNACKGEPNIEKRIAKAMKATANHWMQTNKDEQLRAALAAAMLESDEGECDRIRRNVDVIRALNAAMNGVPVDMGQVMDQLEEAEVLPLRKLWAEAVGDAT